MQREQIRYVRALARQLKNDAASQGRGAEVDPFPWQSERRLRFEVLMRSRNPVLLVVALAVSACRLSGSAPAAPSGAGAPPEVGPDASVTINASDAGANPGDGGAVMLAACDSDAGPAADGAIQWRAGQPASMIASDTPSWIRISPDVDCDSLAPPQVPPSYTWSAPDAGPVFCFPPSTDLAGNLMVSMISAAGFQSRFFPADGSSGGILTMGRNEAAVAAEPLDPGFFLLTQTARPVCSFVRTLRPDATQAGQTRLVAAAQADRMDAIIHNPLGGYVEALDTVRDQTVTLRLRWTNDTFQPIGDWHDVMSWTQKHNDWSILVDNLGRAVVLSFTYPFAFGPSPAPDTWAFAGQWVDASGPIGAPFAPGAPVFTGPDGTKLFAGWGDIVALPDGGFAAYHAPASAKSGGTITPSGWYAHYGIAEATSSDVPDWLRPYDDSLRALTRGHDYAAVRRDPGTCDTTVILISDAGTACYSLTLRTAGTCDAVANVTPEGTLYVENGCALRWWPAMAITQQ